MHEHPFFGLGTAKRYEEQVRLRGANSFRDFLMIHFEQWIVRRRIVSANFQRGIDRLHILSSLGRHFRRAAQKKNAVAPLRREFNQKRNEVRTRDPFGQWSAEPVRSPDQWLAI